MVARPQSARRAGGEPRAGELAERLPRRRRTPGGEVPLMGMLGWVLMGLAIWHFTIWLPDRFWGGIVGALVGSLIGSVVLGVIIFAVTHTFAIPGKKATDVAVVCYAIPGALIGIAVVYALGVRREQHDAIEEPAT